MLDIAAALESQGFTLVSGVADSSEVEALKNLFETANIDRAKRNGETFGARNLLAWPAVRHAAQSPSLADLLRPVLGAEYQAVRGLFFDKTEGANWPVLWHQDLSLAVEARHDLPGWINWSVKRGVQHVQPPAEILSRMITMRLHLDDCPADNGPLRVVAGSHRHGMLSRDAIRATVGDVQEQAVTAEAGDALFMRPLLLHACPRPAAPAGAASGIRAEGIASRAAGLGGRDLKAGDFAAG